VQEDEDAPPEIATVIGTVLQADGDEQLLPETGYLSDTRYTSVFFGLALDLPAPIDQRIMLPLMAKGQHALLALSFKNGSRESSITITASEPSNPIPEMTEEERQKAFQAWANYQPQLRRVPPDWMMRSGHFYHVQNHIGGKYGLLYWTKIKNYKLHFEIVSNDPEFLKKAKHAMDSIQVYCPTDDGTLTTRDGDPVLLEGKPYQGPTVPTAHVDARLSDKTEEHEVPAGDVTDNIYRNADLGIEYAVPTGWKVLNVRRSAVVSKPPATPIAQRTNDFLQACSRKLLQVEEDTPRSTAGPARLTLMTLDPACLSLRGPDTTRDRQGAEELAAYLEMLNDFGTLQFAGLVSAQNHVFALYHGTIGEHAPGQELASRESEMIFATRQHKMLLLWILSASNGPALDGAPQSTVRLDGADSIDLGPAMFRKK
jgi:hypothetical protein